jgi:hypothetical protein
MQYDDFTKQKNRILRDLVDLLDTVPDANAFDSLLRALETRDAEIDRLREQVTELQARMNAMLMGAPHRRAREYLTALSLDYTSLQNCERDVYQQFLRDCDNLFEHGMPPVMRELINDPLNALHSPQCGEIMACLSKLGNVRYVLEVLFALCGVYAPAIFNATHDARMHAIRQNLNNYEMLRVQHEAVRAAVTRNL